MRSPLPRNRLLLVAALVLLVAALSIGVYRSMGAGSVGGVRGLHGKGMRGDSDRPIPVSTATVGRGDLKIFLNGLGTVTPVANVLVRSRVDGELLRVHFQEGQTVRAGDLLAEIDPRAFQVQLTQAEGQHARDKALLQNSRIDLERYQLLWSQDSIAKQQVDAQQSLVHQYEGAVQADQGQIDDARLQLAYARVTAPISGRVGLRQVDPGNIVHASDTAGLVSIAQVQPITVLFTLPEDNLPLLLQKLQTGASIPVAAYDRQQKRLLANGTLLTIDNQIDTTTGTVKLKAQFRNEDSALFPNQFVNVRMQIDMRRDVALLPTAAVQRGAQDNFVYLIGADHKVTLRSVQVGDTEGDQVVIESGLQVGDQVVVDGIDKLRDGSQVEPMPRAAPNAAQEPSIAKGQPVPQEQSAPKELSAPKESAPRDQPVSKKQSGQSQSGRH
jgi:membrane fusion protein, multidrug efflux system